MVNLSSSTIPRLQELSFLEVAGKSVAENRTFEEIRLALMSFMRTLRDQSEPSGNTALFRLERNDPYRYMSNTTEALAELMRLGFVQRTPLPSTRNALAAYTNRHFNLTAAGEIWITQLRQESRRAGYDVLLKALWRCHSQFAGYLRLLAQTAFLVPTANWIEVQSPNDESDQRRKYVSFLIARTIRAIESRGTGWYATESEITEGIQKYLNERLAAANRRHRPDPYPRNRDFVGACEEALVTFAFRRANLNLDYISHEILRRWTRDLAVANFSYHVPNAPALRFWATAEIVEIEDDLTINRRVGSEWKDKVIDTLPEAFEAARRQEPDNSFVPIYKVRAAVCFKLGVTDIVFDSALREFLARERRTDVPFRVNLDPAQFGNTPPTEQPLKLEDRSRRAQVYHVMTLIQSAERRTQ